MSAKSPTCDVSISNIITRKDKHQHKAQIVNNYLKEMSQQTHQHWINVGTKQRWNNVDRITSIQRRWTNIVSTLKFGWKWKLSQRMFIDVVSTLTKQRWNNVDRVTLIQCWWPNVVSTLILGWKGKLSQRMFIGVEKTALKQLCQYFLYWGSLESGSVIKQN